MVESAPRFALLRTGETTPDANTTECLGYGDGGNGRWRQLQQGEKLSKTEVGSPGNLKYDLLAELQVIENKRRRLGDICRLVDRDGRLGCKDPWDEKPKVPTVGGDGHNG